MRIHLKDIRANALIGVYDEERVKPQRIIINIWIDYEPTNAITSDDVADTLDYCELTKAIIAHVESTDYFLLERLVESVLDIIMQQPLAHHAKVEIDKPDVLKDWANSVSVTSERSQ